MKTLSELQRQLEAATAQLEEVAHGLADLRTAGAARSRGELARFKALGERYPIRGHCLCGREATLQREYLTLLAGLLLTDPAQAEGGWLLLQRIAAGGDAWDALPDALAGAGVLAPEKLDGYTGDVSRAGLGEALLLDAMLLALAAGGSGPAYGYIAGLAELLDCPAERLGQLGELAVAIAQRDRDKVKSLIDRWDSAAVALVAPQAVSVLGFLLYQPSPRSVCLVGDGRAQVPQKVYGEFRAKPANEFIARGVCFSGYTVEFKPEQPDASLTLDGCVIRDIHLGDARFGFYCHDYHHVCVQNCTFQTLSSVDQTVDFSIIDHLLIKNTTFKEISSSRNSADTLWIKADRVQLDTVHMEDISSPHHWFSGGYGYTAVNCTYKNCRGSTQDLPEGFREI